MPRYFPGSEVTLQAFVRDADGVLTNATAVALFWRMRHWNQGRADETATVTHPSTGTYEATIIPLEGGNLYYRWEVTTPDVIEEDYLNIAETMMPVQV